MCDRVENMKVLSLVVPYHSNRMEIRLTDYLIDATNGQVHFVDMADESRLLADPWFASLATPGAPGGVHCSDYRGSPHEFSLMVRHLL